MSIRAARKDLARHGVHLCFLPTYSPEFNAMEPVFRQFKYQEMPRRSYTTRTGLREAPWRTRSRVTAIGAGRNVWKDDVRLLRFPASTIFMASCEVDSVS